MTKIQLVVEMDDEQYYEVCRGDSSAILVPKGDLIDVFRNGTPLPKGHGDLITKEQAIDLVEFYQLNPQHFDFVNLIDEIKDEKPIIEADKED